MCTRPAQGGQAASFGEVIRIGTEPVAGMFSWSELMALGSSVSDEQLLEQQRQQQFDDPINIQYTS